MITIKNNVYNKTELRTITQVLQAAKNELFNIVCPEHKDTCETCPNKHVCYDVCSAFDYCVKVAKTNASN